MMLIHLKLMNKWDKRFCELAQFVSKWSKDPKAKVGCVVFSRKGGDISVGYNGFPFGVEDSAERLNDSRIKLELVVHAEQNALIAAGTRTRGSTLYVWGKPICARCAGPIIQAGVTRVVAPNPESVNKKSKWYKTGMYAKEIFSEAGIIVDFFEVRNDVAQQRAPAKVSRNRARY